MSGKYPAFPVHVVCMYTLYTISCIQRVRRVCVIARSHAFFDLTERPPVRYDIVQHSKLAIDYSIHCLASHVWAAIRRSDSARYNLHVTQCHRRLGRQRPIVPVTPFPLPSVTPLPVTGYVHNNVMNHNNIIVHNSVIIVIIMIRLVSY